MKEKLEPEAYKAERNGDIKYISVDEALYENFSTKLTPLYTLSALEEFIKGFIND